MKAPRSLLVNAMAVCLACACLSVNAQQGSEPTPGRILADSTLWGEDFPAVLGFLPVWQEVGERRVVVFADRVLGATDYETAAAAESRAAALAEAMKRQPAAVRSRSLSELVEGYQAAAPSLQAEIIAFPEADSQRVGWRTPSLRLLADGLTMEAVRERLGPPEEVTQRVVQGEGERRPAVLRGLSYAGGAVVFIETDLVPRPGFVDRVMLDMPAVTAALAAEE